MVPTFFTFQEVKLGSSNLGTQNSVWTSSLGIFWELGRNAELQACPRPTDSDLHFKKVPRGSVCVRSTDLNDTKCQAPELAFLTWSTVSASPIPASSPQRPEPLPFPPQCITCTVCFPISSIHALLKFLFPIPPPFLSCSLITWHLPCYRLLFCWFNTHLAHQTAKWEGFSKKSEPKLLLNG